MLARSFDNFCQLIVLFGSYKGYILSYNYLSHNLRRDFFVHEHSITLKEGGCFFSRNDFSFLLKSLALLIVSNHISVPDLGNPITGSTRLVHPSVFPQVASLSIDKSETAQYNDYNDIDNYLILFMKVTVLHISIKTLIPRKSGLGEFLRFFAFCSEIRIS